jgi:hypothetical protein
MDLQNQLYDLEHALKALVKRVEKLEKILAKELKELKTDKE